MVYLVLWNDEFKALWSYLVNVINDRHLTVAQKIGQVTGEHFKENLCMIF